MKGCHCISCAQANARRKGLKRTQYTMCMATLSTELPGLHNDCEPGDDECEDYEDLEYDSCPELMTETFSDPVYP